MPAVTGSKINWDKTLQTLATTAVADGGNRTTDVVYDDVDPPKLTTEAARKLGVRELISEYTTDGFSSASGENIRLVAAEVDGALVLPGKVFSLNGHTGPRGAAEGYVDSTIINNGRAATAVAAGSPSSRPLSTTPPTSPDSRTSTTPSTRTTSRGTPPRRARPPSSRAPST